MTVGALKRRADFTAVFRRGLRRRYGALTVFTLSSSSGAMGCMRLGIQVKKTLGGAVVRNRLRRQIKEAARRVFGPSAGCWDLVVIPAPEAVARPFERLVEDLARVEQRLAGGGTGHVPRE